MKSGPMFALLGATLTGLLAADWPQYLGQNGDGSTPEHIRTNWAELPPRELWRKPIGQGFSSMAVSAGRLFTLARRTVNSADREVCIALDANTGEELWGADVDAADYTNLSGYDDRMDGPRSTPTIEGDRVYVFTSQLKLWCLSAGTGTVVWSRDFRAEFGSTLIPWENAASPLLVGDLLFVNANAPGQRLMAVRKTDGVTVWSGQDDPMTHSTPVFARIADVPQIVFLTRLGLVGVVPETGGVLWRLGFSPAGTSTAASPAVVDNYVYASAAYGAGTWMAQVTKNGLTFTAAQAWRQQGNAYQAHWSTPVQHEGFLYCVPAPSSGQGRLACLDVVAGTNRWTQTAVGSGTLGYGSVIKAADALIVLTEAGELVLVQPNPDAYMELARLQVLKKYCWNHVTLSNGRIYARNTSLAPEIVALDVALPDAPQPELRLAVGPAFNGGIALTATTSDGATPDPATALDLEVLSSTDLMAPLSEWGVLAAPFMVTNGAYATEVPVGDEPARYLRVGRKSASR